MSETRVALYERVSSAEQDLQGQDRELREYAKRRGWSVAAIYAEKVSGTGRDPRPEYDRLVRDAAAPTRAWDAVLCWSLDRFSRAETFTEATRAILDLERAGVRFYSVKEPGLDSPDDGLPSLGRDVLLALLPVISSFESKRRRERTRLAMSELKSGRRKTRSGRPVGRPPRITAELLERIAELRASGRTWAQIAQTVHHPSGSLRAWHSRSLRETARAIKRQEPIVATSVDRTAVSVEKGVGSSRPDGGIPP